MKGLYEVRQLEPLGNPTYPRWIVTASHDDSLFCRSLMPADGGNMYREEQRKVVGVLSAGSRFMATKTAGLCTYVIGANVVGWIRVGASDTDIDYYFMKLDEKC